MAMKLQKIVIPAKAGIHAVNLSFKKIFKDWIPAFAGMTACAGMPMLFAAPLFAEPHAFPVPFVSKQHTSIFFSDLPGPGNIKIFTISGEEVIDLPIPPGQGQIEWPGPLTNSAGEKVATGVYLFVVDADGKKSTGKLVVIR